MSFKYLPDLNDFPDLLRIIEDELDIHAALIQSEPFLLLKRPHIPTFATDLTSIIFVKLINAY